MLTYSQSLRARRTLNHAWMYLSLDVKEQEAMDILSKLLKSVWQEHVDEHTGKGKHQTGRRVRHWCNWCDKYREASKQRKET